MLPKTHNQHTPAEDRRAYRRQDLCHWAASL